MKNKNLALWTHLLCMSLVLLMLPLAAFSTMAAEGESFNFALGQQIEADNSYIPPEGFFDVSFLNDGEWLTYDDSNVKLGWNSDPFVIIGENDPIEITVSLDTFYLLEKIMIYPMKWSNGVNFPREYELLGSTDGDRWFEVYAKQTDMTAEAADNLSVQPKEYVLDSPVSIRYFRLRITRQSPVVDQTGASTSALGEIELYGVKDAAAEEEAAKALAQAKETAKTELESYRAGKDNKDYRDAQVAELDAALAKGLEDVESAKNTDAIDSAVADAKKMLDAVKTDAQLTAEETEAPTEPETEAPTETLTQPEAPTEAPTQAETEAPTEAPTEIPTGTPTEAPVEGDTKPAGSGCGAAVSMMAWVTVIGGAALCLCVKKKK